MLRTAATNEQKKISMQNHSFHRSRCVDGVKKCTTDMHFSLKINHFSYKNHTIFFFFAKRHQICPHERKRTPKELRASRSVTTAKNHTQRPGRAKTVARERKPLHRLHRLHRTSATNDQKNRTHLYPAKRTRVQRGSNPAAAAWRW